MWESVASIEKKSETTETTITTQKLNVGTGYIYRDFVEHKNYYELGESKKVSIGIYTSNFVYVEGK